MVRSRKGSSATSATELQNPGNETIETASVQSEKNDNAESYKDKEEVNLHVWTLRGETQNKCGLFSNLKVKLASLGDDHSLLLTREHVVFTFGNNKYGQLGLGDTENRIKPCQVTGLTEKPVIKVLAGSRHSGSVCKQGEVYCWGDSRQGQCGVGERGLFTTPCRVRFIEASSGTVAKIRELSLGGIHSLAIDYRGFVWAFGSGAALGLGGVANEALFPVKIKSLMKKRAIAVSAGELHSLAILQEDFHGSHFQVRDDPEVVSQPDVPEVPSERRDQAIAIPFLENEFYTIQDSSYESNDHQFEMQQKPSFTRDAESSSFDSCNDNRSVLLQDNAFATDQECTFAESLPNLEKEFVNRNTMLREFENPLFDRSRSRDNDNTPELFSIDGTSKDLKTTSFTNKLFTEREYTSTDVSQISDLFETSCTTVVTSDVESGSDKTQGDALPTLQKRLQLSLLKQEMNFNSIASSSPEKKVNVPFDGSTGDIFQSAFDVFPNSTESAPDQTSIVSRETLNAEISEAAGKEKVLESSTASILTKETLTDAASDWEIKRSSPSPKQPSKGSIFHFKSSQDKRKRTQSAWSVGSNLFQSDFDGSRFVFPIAGATEVWGWGRNTYGQLGTNDTKDSLTPNCIEKLSRKGIVKVAAGTNHSLALTNYAQVYAWGDNSYNQITFSNNLGLLPKRIKLLCDVRVWDIAAGKSFSLFLGDNFDNDSTDVYFCGSTDRKDECTHPLQEFLPQEKKKSEKKKRRSLRGKRSSDSAGVSSSAEIKKIVHFRKDVIIRSVCACDGQFACLSQRKSSESLAAVYSFAHSERKYYCQLAMIQFVVIEPFKQTDQWTTGTKLPGGESLFRLIDSFSDLVSSVATGLTQITDVIQQGHTAKDLLSFLFSDSFRTVYERFSKCYCDALAVGQIHFCNKSVSSLISKAKDAMKKALKEHELPSLDFEHLLKIPLSRHQVYQNAVEENVNLMNEAGTYKMSDIAQLEEVKSRWYLFEESNALGLKEAEKTRIYWEECPHKLMEVLREPQRRLLRTSRTEPLSLARASRLSNHSFVLFNDVFVHIQFNRNFQVFPLVTMWAEPEKDTSQIKNAFLVSAPEQSFVLCAADSAGKIGWLCEINKAIASCLSVSSSHCIDITAVNMCTGTLRAAVAREAWYTFVNHPQYKGARYTGMWLSGQPHGRGRLEWPDGAYYEGEFVKGHFEGYGIMVYQPIVQGDAEKRYEGEWLEGKMRGFGKMTYGNKNEYLGHWRDNVREGHGTMKHFSSASALQTVYVGDWVNDQRHGYGVLDLIVRGEKYMGMWANDQRHGQGFVVTVDGVYYEGKFVQNKLVGKGVLLSDDETCYEGEFTADMLLNGKGILTFQNGDFIDGTFFGKWGEGIKLSGTFFKFSNPDPTCHGEFGNLSHTGNSEFTILADMKWKSLFYECKESLGYDGILEPNEYRVWAAVQECILRSQALSMLRRQTRSDYGNELLAQGGKVEDRSKFVQDLKTLQNYLEKAFDTFGHPLNTLVDGLVEVYRTTYVGVGAHRRLLSQAVAEAKSYVTRLFSVIRLLFPDLHDEEFVLLTNNTFSGVCDSFIDSSSLLHPILLPRLYPTLFTLYALHTEKGDALYAERLHQLNKRGSVALMSFLCVSRKFWLCEDSLENSATVRPYQSAIDMLGTISTTYSPMEKIGVIRQSFAKLHDEVDRYWKGEHKIGCMDDLFPVFQYIVVRARIPHLGSEIQFIEDLVDQSIMVSESGHMLTTLKACYFQIQNEQDRE